MDNRFDVVIVGGGLSGCSTAYWLANSPDFTGTILVVERDPTYENAPSAKATGGIRQQFSTPENVQIGLFGAEFVKSIEDRLAVDGESTGVLFREQGYLLLGNEDQMPVLHENNKLQRELGADIVYKDHEGLKTGFPWVNANEVSGGFFGERDEGWVDPYTFLQSFRRKARSLGVNFIQDEALAVLADGRQVSGVHLERAGIVHAGAVVNTAGAHGARAMTRSVGIDLPIESRLRCTFVFECRDTSMSGGPLTVLPNGVAWRPEGARFLANVAPPPERDPETHAHNIDHALFDDVIWPSLAKYIPAFEAIKVVQTYSCHYDFNTLDENVIVGLAGEFDNFYLAAGFSGHGMQQSPAIGRALSELICFGEYRTIDLGRFGFERVLSGNGVFENNCW